MDWRPTDAGGVHGRKFRRKFWTMAKSASPSIGQDRPWVDEAAKNGDLIERCKLM
jgi:hypothetical protein